MEVLVTYDVATDTPEGRRRLRRVAQVCLAHGQRVQKSVFECVLEAGQLDQMIAQLMREIDESEDSLRIYRLREPRARSLRVIGRGPSFDIREPMVI